MGMGQLALDALSMLRSTDFDIARFLFSSNEPRRSESDEGRWYIDSSSSSSCAVSPFDDATPATPESGVGACVGLELCCPLDFEG